MQAQLCYATTNTEIMNELIYKPEELTGHPNSGIEEEMRSIVMLVEMGNNEEDIKSIYCLNDKVLIKKFDLADIALLIEFKERYDIGIKLTGRKKLDFTNWYSPH